MKDYLKLLFAASIIALSSCAEKAKNLDPNHIRVGITSGPEKAIAEAAKKVAKEKYNLDVELVTFDDYVIPNEALDNGDIDLNAFQHIPYLNEQSKQRGYQLEVVGKSFLFPIVAYSKQIKHIDELQDGSTIAIPNDPSNGGRALLLLQDYGLIKLDKRAGILPRVIDIVQNPQNLKIIEIEAPQLPRVLDDKQIALAVINNNFAISSGLSPDKDGVIIERKSSEYINVLVARVDNKDAQKVQNFVKAYQSDEVAKAAYSIFKDGAIKVW